MMLLAYCGYILGAPILWFSTLYLVVRLCWSVIELVGGELEERRNTPVFPTARIHKEWSRWRR